jgi:predicted RNase H-like nuclease (RuvC/YqgF family)
MKTYEELQKEINELIDIQQKLNLSIDNLGDEVHTLRTDNKLLSIENEKLKSTLINSKRDNKSLRTKIKKANDNIELLKRGEPLPIKENPTVTVPTAYRNKKYYPINGTYALNPYYNG